MADTAPTFDFSDHPFALKRCAVCDYDLTGQPVPRRCPECGRQYDASALQIYGTGMVHTVWRRYIGLLGLLWWPVFIPRWKAQLLPVMPWIAAASVVLIVYILYRRRENRRRFDTLGGALQLIIDRTGIARRNGPGVFELVPWAQLPHYRLSRRYRWKLTRSSVVPASWYLFFASESRIEQLKKDKKVAFSPQIAEGNQYLDILFESQPEESQALEKAITQLQRAAVTPADTRSDQDTT